MMCIECSETKVKINSNDKTLEKIMHILVVENMFLNYIYIVILNKIAQNMGPIKHNIL